MTPAAAADWDADRALTELYGLYYPALVRLASLLVHDAATAEEVVQDSFVALQASRRRLRDRDGALSYLRHSVVNRCRLALRHRALPVRAAAGPEPSAVVSALRAMPARRREALVMRYYAGLSEPQIAEIMGISRRAVRQHAEQAMAALRTVLEPAGDQAAARLPVHWIAPP